MKAKWLSLRLSSGCLQHTKLNSLLCWFKLLKNLDIIINGLCYDTARQHITYISITLFQFIVYPDNWKLSIFTTWIFPLSVPTYSHLDENGRCIQVNLQ